MFEESLLPRWFLGSNSDREIPFTEGRDATCKTVNLNADKTLIEQFHQYFPLRGDVICGG